MKRHLLLIAALLMPAMLQAQSTQKFRIADLKFMAGAWKASSDWGDMDESWSVPSGNSMMCSYRCVKNGKVVFYEFVVIEQNENDPVPVMKLRHFNPGSIGWEDKENPYSYPLIELTATKATFERPDKKMTLSYERISPESMKAVLVQEREGKKVTTEF